MSKIKTSNDPEYISKKVKQLVMDIKAIQDSKLPQDRTYREKLKELSYWRHRQVQTHKKEE